MRASTLLGVILCLAGGLLMAPVASATITTVTFFEDSSPPDNLECGVPWVENGIEMRLEPLGADDCSADGCSWFRIADLPGHIMLDPARIIIDVSALDGELVSVETDMQGATEETISRLHAYNGDELLLTTEVSGSSGLETLRLETTLLPVTHVVVSSCGGICFEVRMETAEPTPTVKQSWGAVKARFD